MQHKIVNFRADRISGWFYDPDSGEAKSTLDVVVDGETAQRLTCRIFRDELSAEDFSDRNIGFLGTLPPRYWTGETHRVELVHRLSGTVLAEKRMSTRDRRIPEAPGVFAEFMVSERGQLAGWASQDEEPLTVRVLADEQELDRSPADQGSFAWKRTALKFDAPRGFMHSLQLPPWLFDDEEHRIQVLLPGLSGREVTVLDDHLTLPAAYRSAAEQEQERITRGRADRTSGWESPSAVRPQVRLGQIELTPSYVAITLDGSVKHRRAVIRVGEETAVLTAVDEANVANKANVANTGAAAAAESVLSSMVHRLQKLRGRIPGLGSSELAGSGDGPPGAARGSSRHTVARRRLAGPLPSGAVPAAGVRLYAAGDQHTGTYDLRLGDETGQRPTALPTQVTELSPGALHTCPPRIDGGAFTGWALHTGATELPVDLVLAEIIPSGTVELARVQAVEEDQQAKSLHGVRRAGYILPLPVEAMEREAHLKLVAVHGSTEQVLWEEQRFSASDGWLLDQALQATTVQRALTLITRARQAGRTEMVERFLASYRRSRAGMRLEDVESAVVDYAGPPGHTLEPAFGAVWYWVEELRRNRGRIRWFTQNAVRNRNGGARDVLAYAATQGRFDFGQLHGILESHRAPQFRDQAETLLKDNHSCSGMICMAHLLYAAPRDETDRLDALTLYSMVEAWRGLEAIVGPSRAFYGDLLRWRGAHEESRRVLTEGDPDPEHSYSQRLLALNAVNPDARGDGGPQDWLESFNARLAEGGAAPVRLTGGEDSFFALDSTLEPGSAGQDGPLVSVLMPIYEPSEATDLAVDSLLKQTWGNLEILLMDDCSPQTDDAGNPTGHQQRLEALAARDQRIRLVLNETNRGAYSVRNDGLDLARGELITVADKDDWHHPQQIEIQVRDLQDRPEKIATMTNWVRVDENLTLLLRSGTGLVHYPSMPSLMFRRDPVLSDLGYWDTVRKSGDSEFKGRIESHYGVSIEPVVTAPLACALMEGANLTRDDMGVGYLAPERRAYLRGYQKWHRAIREDGESPFVPKGPGQRRFAAPADYLPDGRQAGPAQYDVVFASEFGFLAGNSTSLFTEISVCLEAGLRVGVLPFQNGLIPSAAKRQFNAKVDELVLTGQIDRLSPDAEAQTDLLIVRWPTALQAVRDVPTGLRAGGAVVVANHPPYEPGGRRSYDIGTVTRNVEQLFGVRPVWAPQSEQIGEMLRPLMPASDLAPCSWKGIIEVKEDAVRNRYRDGPPVIGRHGRDDPAKWPSDRETFHQVYPSDGSARVCILGGTKTPTQLGFLPRNPQGWEIYEFNEIEVSEYLGDKLDFFVYFHSDGWVEAFGMAILEAMSYGVVCVLPRHFEPVFGEAAVYAEPHEVQPMVRRLWDAERYAAQQRCAVEFIERECTPAAYLRRLSLLGVEAAA